MRTQVMCWLAWIALAGVAHGQDAGNQPAKEPAKEQGKEEQDAPVHAPGALAIALVQTFDADGKRQTSGSGAFVGESLFVTSLQVVDVASMAKVVTACCGEFEVEGVVAVDENAGLALLRVKTDPQRIQWLQVAAAPPQKGDEVQVTMIIIDAGVALLGNKAISLDTWPGYGPMVHINTPLNGLIGTSPVLNEKGEIAGVVVFGGPHDTSLASVLTPDMLAPGELVTMSVFGKREASNRVKGRREVLAGILLADQNDWAGAAKAYRQALELDPQAWRAQWLLGVALDMSGKSEESIEVLKAAAKMCPLFSEPLQSLGFVHLKLGRDAEAFEYYDQTVKLDPDYAQAHNMRGVVLYQMGRVDEAIASLEKSVDVDPGDKRNCSNLTFICQKEKRPAPLASAWRRYTEKESGDSEGWMMLASVLDPEKDADEILLALRRAAKLEPDDAAIRLRLAVQLAEQKHYDEAMKETVKCLEIDPKNSIARQLKKLIEQEKQSAAPSAETEKK
ncbi:MAG: tetratricopeptide repeat protein [Pyrinomonadaceae bacterium]|nr:tetratricopeptide repeat protein [Phycisphaerales bacterium]